MVRTNEPISFIGTLKNIHAGTLKNIHVRSKIDTHQHHGFDSRSSQSHDISHSSQSVSHPPMHACILRDKLYRLIDVACMSSELYIYIHAFSTENIAIVT